MPSYEINSKCFSKTLLFHSTLKYFWSNTNINHTLRLSSALLGVCLQPFPAWTNTITPSCHSRYTLDACLSGSEEVESHLVCRQKSAKVSFGNVTREKDDNLKKTKNKRWRKTSWVVTTGQLSTATLSFVGPQPASGSRANIQAPAGGIVKPRTS